MVKTKVHGHCDLCWGRDGFKEMKLLTCPDCGVAFHCECYGVDADSLVQVHNQAYPCGACRSVGETFTGRDHTGKEHAIQQKERPTECCLCSVDEGIALPHPMHPLYDNHGESGKQIVLPPDKSKPSRLAWVHTLCAMSITSHSSTGGCVYSCDASGKYEDAVEQKDISLASDGDDGKNDEQVKLSYGSTASSYLPEASQPASKSDKSVHHFVFCHKEKKDDPESKWTKTIRERQALKCTLCGANDKNDGANVSYRIPVQCSANDSAEFKKFQGAHNALCGGPCFVPVHVGCAQWHKNDAGEYPKVTRVYFFPGMSQTSALRAQPATNIFCDLHARDLQVASTTGPSKPVRPGLGTSKAVRPSLGNSKAVRPSLGNSKPLRASLGTSKPVRPILGSGGVKEPPEKVVGRASFTAPSVRMQPVVQAKGVEDKEVCKPSEKVAARASFTASTVQTQPIVQVQAKGVGDKEVSKPPEKVAARASFTKTPPSVQIQPTVQAKAMEDKEVSKPPEKVAARASFTKTPPSVQTQPAATGPPARNMLGTKKSAPESKQYDNELCRIMVQDLVQNYRPLKNNKQRNRVRVARECYWKRQSNLSSEEFRVVWGRVKEITAQQLATEETMIADRKASILSKSVTVKYPESLEKHRELGDAMLRNALIAMEHIDTVDGAAVKAKMNEIRKSSRMSAKGLTLETFKELWYQVKNAVADECGFRYAKPADISAGKDSAAAQAGSSVGPEGPIGEQQHQSSLPPPSGGDGHGQLAEAISAGKSSIDKGKGTGTTDDRRTEKIPEPHERNDAREKQGAQGGMGSKDTEMETSEVSQGPQGIRSGATEGETVEPLNAAKKRRWNDESDTRGKEGGQGLPSGVSEVEMAEASDARQKRPAGDLQSELTDVKCTEPSTAPKKRRLGGVSESKIPEYDGNKKEQWYLEMVVGTHEAIMKPNALEAPGALETILAEHKKRWMKQLGIPNSAFRAIWEKVVQKSKSFKVIPIPTTKKDWSFLVVGKNYNPDGIDFKTWDTYEEIASDPEAEEAL
jgi:hypothetical protein